MGSRPIAGISLFSGIAALDRGVKIACPNSRVVCYVERDPYATAVLVARMHDGAIEEAPIWDEVATFDGRPWRGLVDGIWGGFPCQNVSGAGKGEGLKGEKSSLWVEYARIIGEIQPRFVFIENVAALAIRGLNHVLDDLAALGYDAEWDCFTAQEVGAPHLRKRLFILAVQRDIKGGAVANARRTRRQQKPRGPSGHENSNGREPHGDHIVERQGQGMDDANRVRQPQPEGGEPVFGGRARDTSQSVCGPSILGPFPPGPEDAEEWARVLAEMPDAKPSICRVVDGTAFRIHRLRCLGNAVVPQCAALAFRALYARTLQQREDATKAGVV